MSQYSVLNYKGGGGGGAYWEYRFDYDMGGYFLFEHEGLCLPSNFDYPFFSIHTTLLRFLLSV